MHQILFFTLSVVLLFSCKKGNEAKPDPIENNKAVTWIKSYGGSEYDFTNSIVQLTSGDYVMAGTTRSVDGDISGNRIGFDSWVAKFDVNGTKVWSKTYGANDDDYANAIAACPDGGFIVTGYTYVNNQNFAWAKKIDAYGTLTWEKSLNQSSNSKPANILPAGDGTYFVIGYVSNASQDGWISKIDVNGNAVWTKMYGGAGEDYLTSIIKVNDGFVLTGYSSSTDLQLRNKGSYDGWILKIDASGNKIWSNTFGGNDEDYLKSIALSNDGGYVAAGHTKSKDGDIPKNQGGYDEWVIKVDASGNKQWVKTFGGWNEEYITNIVATPDGSFVTVGYTNSTTGDVYRVNNDFGGWMIKIDGSGNKTAASTYGTDRLDDFTNTLITTQDGGYMMGGYTFVNGRGYDGWLVKIDKL